MMMRVETRYQSRPMRWLPSESSIGITSPRRPMSPDRIRQMMLAHSSIQSRTMRGHDRKLACDRSAKIEYAEAVFFFTICLCRLAQRKGRVRKLSPDRQVFSRN
jgi:hypothetical protein